MTRTSQLEFVKAELAEIQHMEAAGGVAAIGMATRRAELEAEKQNLEASIVRLAATELTFAGDPVVGSRAIRADFAAPALQSFEKAVIALAAAKERPLSARARLPGRAQNKLFVTSIAHGSFGFVLEELDEEVAQQGTLDFYTNGQSPLASAMHDVQANLESSRAADDDLAESLLDVDPRAITLLRGFTETLMRHRALCSVLVGQRRFKFTSHDEVARAYERLSDENIQQEQQVTVSGRLLGFLPESRMFEIRLAEDGKILRGKVDPGVGTQAVHELLDKDVDASVNRVTVGQRAMRGRLLSILPKSALGTTPDVPQPPPPGPALA